MVCPVLPCPALSCPVLSCPVLSCRVLSCPVLSRLVLLMLIISPSLSLSGAVDLHAPMCQYWPAFAANGKETITVVSPADCPEHSPVTQNLILCTEFLPTNCPCTYYVSSLLRVNIYHPLIFKTSSFLSAITVFVLPCPVLSCHIISCLRLKC